jgi:hypothetical protein
MNLHKFFVGRGLEVSEKRTLNDIEHFYKEPNNFYTLKEKVNPESLGFIYSKNLINKTKFHKILLKEWFNFLKVGGRLIVEMENNDILSFDQLKLEIRLLFEEKIKIIFSNEKGNERQIVLEKEILSLRKRDSINKWTFGIITDGSKGDALENQIQSIVNLKIPFFEIIICGHYQDLKKREYIKNIPFKEKIAWITKKKNLICKKAKYENLVITHNRFIFDEGWFDGMKKYGNYFEVLSCKILSPSRKRAGDWLTYGRNIEDRWINEIGLLEYNDWDENGIINGSFHILKKSVWEKCPWDESRVWGMKEDDFLSLSFREKGIVPRFNQFSIINTFPEKYGDWHWKYKFNSKKLGKIPFEFSKKWFMRKIDRFFRKYFNAGFVIKSQGDTYGW